MEKIFAVKYQVPGQWAPTIEYPIAASKEAAIERVKERYPRDFAAGAEIVSVEEQS